MNETQTQVVTLKKPLAESNATIRVLSWIVRVFMVLVSAMSITMGVLFCVTIIGVPVGLYLFYSAKLSWGIVMKERLAPCGNCKRSTRVTNGQQTFVCGKCHEHNRIEWTERGA